MCIPLMPKQIPLQNYNVYFEHQRMKYIEMFVQEWLMFNPIDFHLLE
jgi:hypothetical protein